MRCGFGKSDHATTAPTVTGCSEQLFQLNPVGMGTDEEVGFAMEAPKL